MGETQPRGKHGQVENTARWEHHSKGWKERSVLGGGVGTQTAPQPLPALQVDACASPGLVIRGKKSLTLPFLKGPLPSAGGQPCALRPDSRLWAEPPTVRGPGGRRPALRQDRGWAAPPAALSHPGAWPASGGRRRLQAQEGPLTPEETQAHRKGGRGSGASGEDLLSLQPSLRPPQSRSRRRPAGRERPLLLTALPRTPSSLRSRRRLAGRWAQAVRIRTEELPGAVAGSTRGGEGGGSGDPLAAAPPPRARASGQALLGLPGTLGSRSSSPGGAAPSRWGLGPPQDHRRPRARLAAPGRVGRACLSPCGRGVCARRSCWPGGYIRA